MLRMGEEETFLLVCLLASATAPERPQSSYETNGSTVIGQGTAIQGSGIMVLGNSLAMCEPWDML
jgi:hypothetical protein